MPLSRRYSPVVADLATRRAKMLCRSSKSTRGSGKTNSKTMRRSTSSGSSSLGSPAAESMYSTTILSHDVEDEKRKSCTS